MDDAAAGELAGRRLGRRAVEVALWGMPIVSVWAMRRAFFDAGAEYGDVVYLSRPADPDFQLTTPNTSTYYAFFAYNLADGPVVVEIPAATGAGIFGSFNDAWQIPLADFGPEGEDAGAGGAYLLIPPGHDQPIPDGYIPVQSATVNGYSVSRMIPASTSPEDVRAAIDLVRQVRTYPLRERDAPRTTRQIDIAGQPYDGLAHFDLSFYDALAVMIDEEPILERDRVAMNLAAQIGIVKGKPFTPNEPAAAILQTATDIAHAELIDAASRMVPFWPGTHWGFPGQAAHATGYTFVTDTGYATDERAVLFFIACAPAAKPGTAAFYVLTGQDADGNLLDGAGTYRLHVPAHPPARQYWAVTAYDLTTGGFIQGSPRSSVDSYSDLTHNDDGTVDLWFSTTPPSGRRSNWVYTAPDRPFLLAFRFYGPEPALRDGTWILPDVERVD